MQASDPLNLTLASIKSLAKMLIQSRSCKIDRRERHSSLIILANGPSLRQTIDSSLTKLQEATTMAVNFAANAPDFTLIRPDFYIMVDPHFFSSSPDANLENLRKNLASVDWPMTLIVPVTEKEKLPDEVTANPSITLNFCNITGLEGFRALEHFAYHRGWGLPRPRNVLVPAIACGIWLGFKDIIILGADHSWIKNLEVDSDNRVISVQPHFYKDSSTEQKRIDSVYRDVHLHQVVESFAIALKSYHDLQRWAQNEGVKIYNATPGSFIDAFPRRSWP